ncbi:MAG: endopeptidase La [Erysipelotrichaceae bacterium]|nr:endopeptidase La [Erysipelotrichaceae bacterium]
MSIYSDIYKNVDYPVICTRGMIIFPNQDVVIDVGRPLSVNAMNKARSDYDSLVLVVTQKDIMVDDPAPEDMYSFGTLCSIKHVRDDKQVYKVKFHGLARAQANVLTKTSDMFMANISVVDDIKGDEKEELVLIRKAIQEFEQVAQNFANLPREMLGQLQNGVSSSYLADQFGQYLPMSLSARQEILEAVNVNQRLMLILQQFQVSREIKEVENEINERVKDSVEESQKEYYLRERLKAIKEELGDVSGGGDDVDDLKERFENNPYPESVKKKAFDEINRMEMMPSVSAEASVIRTYLDWLEKVPWWQQSEDRDDINEISKVLEEDHYGLEKVKERILEYIAVKKLTNSLNAPILCLVGPPGVGKTSLAKSIARALDRQFVKISLGGVRDEAEIRGHRRTYLGSMPGRIIQGMKRAGTINPVFLIDELDKMASDYKGDPSSAMLEVLDPEQNSLFSDNYLEEPYDLSKVLFVATANDLYSIPDALRDRLEVIEMSSYTEEEKLHIATDHLIKKELQANGLSSSMFKLAHDEILYIIRHYTREAGVRQLQRQIGKLCRKTALAITKGEKKSVKVSKKLIQEWLGKEIFEYGQKEDSDQVGVATGLAYTQFGGDILPIEVTYFDGKGGLIITGQLGDVMKESATIAVGYVKSNAKKYGIDPKFFEEHDIHIHVPEGAVPKDGPSAGITLTTAVISAITGRKVSSTLAMTGEVTLRGNVLPIGGLREKTMAAFRSDIHKIILPKNNLKDLDDIPQSVKDSMEFVPVKTMDEVLKVALVK